MCPRVLFSPSVFFSPPTHPISSTVVGELGCCHKVLFLRRLINMLPFFLSFRGEDAAGSKCWQTAWRSQRVGTSLISNFLLFPFPKLWICRKNGEGVGAVFHRHQTAAPVLSWRWHDMQTCSRFTWQKGGFLLTWLLPSNLLLSDTPMTHFKPLSWGGRLHVAV